MEENRIGMILINSTCLSCNFFDMSYVKVYFLFLSKGRHSPMFSIPMDECGQ